MATPEITYEVCIDWDATNWSYTPDFSQDYDEISGDIADDGIKFWSIKRGKQKEEGNAPAATLELTLTPGLCAKYSPFTSGVLVGKVRPWLPVRVRAYRDEEYGEEWIPLFFGYISKIQINPHPDVQSVSIYCTDGTDLLARQVVSQDYTETTSMSDGEAVEKVLDAAGWSGSKRRIDKSAGNILKYPNVCTY